jgi:hypothetical protein
LAVHFAKHRSRNKWRKLPACNDTIYRKLEAHATVRSDSYFSNGAKSISKPDGGQRNLGIPSVIDRLIQQAILQVLTPIFDPGFSESSFGFRPCRSAHGAGKQVQSHIRAGYRQCVDMERSRFFDRGPHDVLMARVSRKVSGQSE